MTEIWKDIPNYPDYQVSDMGRVKRVNTGRILKPQNRPSGYLFVSLSSNGVKKSISIHKLVAISFLNHKPDGHKEVVNHIDGNKLNNSVLNLELTTQRGNVFHYVAQKHSSSKYVGVCWCKRSSKWLSTITINCKQHHIGYFDTEREASLAYQKRLSQLLNV